MHFVRQIFPTPIVIPGANIGECDNAKKKSCMQITEITYDKIAFGETTIAAAHDPEENVLTLDLETTGGVDGLKVSGSFRGDKTFLGQWQGTMGLGLSAVVTAKVHVQLKFCDAGKSGFTIVMGPGDLAVTLADFKVRVNRTTTECCVTPCL